MVRVAALGDFEGFYEEILGVEARKYPDGGMRNTPGPLSGVPLASEIFEGKQKPRRITYSEDMAPRYSYASM